MKTGQVVVWNFSQWNSL